MAESVTVGMGQFEFSFILFFLEVLVENDMGRAYFFFFSFNTDSSEGDVGEGVVTE